MEKTSHLLLYRKMQLVRQFEETVAEISKSGEMYGTTHLATGQEAAEVGVISVLSDSDFVVSNHRGHGHLLLKGACMITLFAELLGREGGICKGRGGSMHLLDFAHNNVGENGVVGGGIPIATGVALSQKLQKTNAVTVCFFGDGATNSGAFHEALNFAAVQKLPIVFVCENNQYGMSTPIAQSVKIQNLAARALAYGICGERVDGNDLLAVKKSAEFAVRGAQNGEPSLLVLETYRSHGHSRSDDGSLRDQAEVAKWGKRDPIRRFENVLMREGVSEEEIKAVEVEVKAEVEAALNAARAQSAPRGAEKYVFSEGRV